MNPSRVARVDLSGVSAEDAADVLSRMEGAIKKEVGRVANVRIAGADVDDLYAIGQLAVLEAFVTYTENRGRTFDSWAYQVLRWRLHEAVQAAHAVYLSETCSDKVGEILSQETHDAPSPEDLCIRLERASRVKKHIAQLPPRAGLALMFKLQGESLVQIGASVGVHSSLVCREVKQAVRTVVEALRREEQPVRLSEDEVA